MINQETKLKLQAFLDDELNGAERRQVAAQLESDPEARALHAHLREVKALLQVGEPEIKLPESREFYWSKIERSIRSTPQARPATSFLQGYPRWLRILVPAAGVGLVLTLTLSLIRTPAVSPAMSYLHEVETPLEDTSAIVFHSQSAAMTVVWVQSQGN